jgi:hypothetical protein
MLIVVLGTIAIVLAAIAIGVVVDKKVGFLADPKDFETEEQRKRKQLVSHGAGEAPATALHVRQEQVAKLRASQRCTSCRGVMTFDRDDTARYDGRDLTVLHFTCAKCGATRSLYILIR